MKLIKVLVSCVFLQASCAASTNHVDRLYQRYTECLKNKKDTRYNKSELKQDLDDLDEERLDYVIRQDTIRKDRVLGMLVNGFGGFLGAIIRSGMQGAPVTLKAFMSGLVACNLLLSSRQFILFTADELSDNNAALLSIAKAIQRERKKLEDEELKKLEDLK